MTTSNIGTQIGSAAWLEDLQQRTTKLQEDIGNSVVTISSPDEAVTVTVGPNGALQDLSLGHRATTHSHTRLTTLIMNTVRAAQREAAEQVSAAFVPFGDAGLAEHTKKFITYEPPEDEADAVAADEEPDEDMFVPDDLTKQPEKRPEPLSAPQPPPASGRSPRRSADDDQNDELEPW